MPIYDMQLVLPNENGKLFLNGTTIACDDWEKACTLYRFQIKNNGYVAIVAWFKVSVVGGEPLWESTYSLPLDPGETSDVINSFVCAPADVPVGTHTIKVEVGPAGMDATDTYTEDIYVVEEITERVSTWFSYGGEDYPLEGASIHVIDWATDGSLYNETCNSHWLQVLYGCDFELGEGMEYEATASKDGYHSDSLRLIAGEAANELWLTPREPTVVTEDASLITPTSAQLNGLITDMDGLDSVGFHFTYWPGGGSQTNTHTSYPTGTSAHASGITGLLPATTYYFQAVTINETEDYIFHAYGETKQFTTLGEPVANMYIILPNANGKLFLSNTIIACDDPEQACTEFRFLIMNTGSVTANAWYKVSIVGGGTLYSDTIPNLAPQVGSSYIDDWICALPGGLPVGTHTVKVEVGIEGSATATDTYTEDIYVIEEPLYDIKIELPYTTFLEKAEIVKGNPVGFNPFGLKNNTETTIYAWYTIVSSDLGIDIAGFNGPFNPGTTTTLSLADRTTPAALGTYDIALTVGPSPTDSWADALDATDFRTEQLTIIAPIAPPSGVYIGSENYINVCGDEIADNCINADIFVEHFGSDNTCSVYLEYWNEGDTVHNSTDPIVVPYDPMYDEEGGFEIQWVTACIPNCELDHYIRAVASNSFGTGYSEVMTPITVRLEAPTEITQTSVTLNAYIVSMGTITTGIALFKYGTPTPDTYDHPDIAISSVGAISRTITGLVPNTTYQYSLLARNKYGYPQTFSTTFSFTTLGEVPVTSWEFNTDGDAEGWYPVNQLTPFVVSGGTLKTSTTSTDPYMHSEANLNVNGAELRYVIIKMKASLGNTAEIFFTTTDEQTFNVTKWKQFTITPGSDFITYTIDMSEVPKWYNGIIHQLRLDPSTSDQSDIEIDYIRLTAMPESYDITFIATAPGISDLHDVDVNDITDPQNPLYLGKT